MNCITVVVDMNVDENLAFSGFDVYLFFSIVRDRRFVDPARNQNQPFLILNRLSESISLMKYFIAKGVPSLNE